MDVVDESETMCEVDDGGRLPNSTKRPRATSSDELSAVNLLLDHECSDDSDCGGGYIGHSTEELKRNKRPRNGEEGAGYFGDSAKDACHWLLERECSDNSDGGGYCRGSEFNEWTETGLETLEEDELEMHLDEASSGAPGSKSGAPWDDSPSLPTNGKPSTREVKQECDDCQGPTMELQQLEPRHRLLNVPDGVAAMARTELPLGQQPWTFGVVSAGIPFWKWSVEAGGLLSWTWNVSGDSESVSLSPTVARGSAEKDDWKAWLLSHPVDVILFDSRGPSSSDPLWDLPGLQLVAWYDGRRRSKPPRNSPWSVFGHSLSHEELGGVTTARAKFFVATRIGEDKRRKSLFRLLKPVSLGIPPLGSLTKGTQQGVPCHAPTEAETSAPLDAKNRSARRVLPSVFTKTRFVRRVLTDQEWLSCFDCPARVVTRLNDKELGAMASSVRVPYKLRFHLVRSISNYLETEASPGEDDTPRTSGTSKRSRGYDDSPDIESENMRPPQRSKRRRVLESEDTSKYWAEEAKVKEWVKEQDYSGLRKWASHPNPSGTPSPMTTPLRNALFRIALQRGERVTRAPMKESANVSSDDPNRNLKAVKADDAKIPVHWWDNKVREALKLSRDKVADDRLSWCLDRIRQATLYFWKRKVASSFWLWWARDKHLRSSKGLPPRHECLEPGLHALHHSVDASWFDWDRGSAPFFWRFPAHWQAEARDGLRPRFVSDPPQWRKPQQPPKDKDVGAKERAKISKVRRRGYISAMVGIVSLLFFFSVPKGESDIRMVFDGTKSGLNEALFAPWFFLPTVNTMLRSVDDSYWGADNDYGEMFLNFWLHPDLRKYCGVDLTHTFPDEVEDNAKVFWEAWWRNAMGLSPSPYASCQMGTRLKRLMLGDRHDKENVFRWDQVVLNLPGSADYDPTKPWVYKSRKDGSIAADIHKYVDDARETAPTEPEVDLASSRVAKLAAYFGCQDAARKRRNSSQTPGAWAGACVEATTEGVYKTVSQERWDKTKQHLEQIETWLEDGTLPHKELERIRGFLVYVSLTYTLMAPYLKGLHLTLENWRPDRDEDGWRLTSVPDSTLGEKMGVPTWETDQSPPKLVSPVPRLRDDVKALKSFTRDMTPLRLRARPRKGCAVIFIFGDASGHGFGSSLWIQGSHVTEVEEGVWTKEYSNRSSNFRELTNIARRLRSALLEGKIDEGAEVFLFTDNQVTENAFYRGTSTSKRLFEAVLDMRVLECEFKIFVHVIWVAGTRMIAQGTDGFSRGDLENGVATGASMLSYVPLHLDPFRVNPRLKDWILSTVDCQNEWQVLDANGWFDQGHGSGRYIWSVPAAAGDAALDQLCEAKLANPNSSHIFLIPTVMTARWRKRLGKQSDVVFTVKAGVDCWPRDRHEPLTVALIFPFLSRRPWQIKFDHTIQNRISTSLFGVWAQDTSPQRDCLRELWAYSREWSEV